MESFCGLELLSIIIDYVSKIKKQYVLFIQYASSSAIQLIVRLKNALGNEQGLSLLPNSVFRNGTLRS